MCLRVLKESNKSRFDRYSRQKQCIDHIPYFLSGLSRAHFSNNLSRNSCIHSYKNLITSSAPQNVPDITRNAERVSQYDRTINVTKSTTCAVPSGFSVYVILTISFLRARTIENVIITYRFLAVHVQENRDFF